MKPLYRKTFLSPFLSNQDPIIFKVFVKNKEKNNFSVEEK